MKRYLIIVLAGATIFFACKKNSGSNTNSVDPANPSDLTASLKVWHGTIVTGTPPAPTSNPNSPQLSPGTSPQQSAYKGGYVVITPQVTNGDVAGYYLKINGASSYFKVDYSMAVHRPAVAAQHRPASFAHHAAHHIFSRPQGDPTNNDSSIVIQLPPGIAPGTFCFTYWAYDYDGNVSNEVTQCITVVALGTSAGDWTGTWKFDSEKDVEFDSTGGGYLSDTSWLSNSDSSLEFSQAYNEYYSYSGDISYSNRLYCYYGTIETDSLSGSTPTGFPAYYDIDNDNVTFSANGAYQGSDNDIEKSYDPASTCGNIFYDVTPYLYSETGGWAFDPSTNIFTAIYEGDDSLQTMEADQYNVIEKTSNTIIMSETYSEPGYSDVSYIKLVKQ